MLDLLSAWLIWYFPVREVPRFADHYQYPGYCDYFFQGKNPSTGKDLEFMVGIYYPAEFKSEDDFQGYLKDHNPTQLTHGHPEVRGLVKVNGLPKLIFDWMRFIPLNVAEDAPTHKLPPGEKYIPIIYTHGLMGSRRAYTNITKSLSLAKGNFIVFNLEHSDGSSLVYKTPNLEGYHLYESYDADVKDQKGLSEKEYRSQQLEYRHQEIAAFIHKISKIDTQILPGITGGDLDMSKLSLLGHSFGATTAINSSSLDDRIKYVMIFDPWMIPMTQEALKRPFKQPCLLMHNHYFHQIMLKPVDNYGVFMEYLKERGYQNMRQYILQGVGHYLQVDQSVFFGKDYRFIRVRNTKKIIEEIQGQQACARMLQLFATHIIANNEDWSTYDAEVTAQSDKEVVDDISDLRDDDLDSYRKHIFTPFAIPGRQKN
eukprot:CAMPEP_0115023132 /NCGR_PEP_ID=MMETSP0216-20121206/32145_1 /TAXON_ID=223996 /ORGANISM="Protocruzia adherens, Strain Boccale" /LENGTH=427 /DNA_ID=CAMNT_0002396311 /DNA_START=620 /DNA_END=1903 /DNA_ORIENTATION=+